LASFDLFWGLAMFFIKKIGRWENEAEKTLFNYNRGNPQ
jgi:hypothetical protein